MSLWTFALFIVAAFGLLALRSYLAYTRKRLEVHLAKIELLASDVADPLDIVRKVTSCKDLKQLTAGFALSDARNDCLEGLKWIERAEDFEPDNGPPVPSRLKADFFAWLLMRESQDPYLVALKMVRPELLRNKDIKRLSKLEKLEHFHHVRATEFIERLNRD